MQKKKSLILQRLLFVSRVELEGIEPSSAQGNHMLSTCLFQPSIFEVWQDLDHQPYPYPLKFHPDGEAHHRLFPIYLHRLTLRFGTTSLERCLVPSPCDGIKPVIYCTSIRQRERNCFRQLNFMSTMIMEIADESPRAYVPFHLAVKSMSTPRLRRYFDAKISISPQITK